MNIRNLNKVKMNEDILNIKEKLLIQKQLIAILKKDYESFVKNLPIELKNIELKK